MLRSQRHAARSEIFSVTRVVNSRVGKRVNNSRYQNVMVRVNNSRHRTLSRRVIYSVKSEATSELTTRHFVTSPLLYRPLVAPAENTRVINSRVAFLYQRVNNSRVIIHKQRVNNSRNLRAGRPLIKSPLLTLAVCFILTLCKSSTPPPYLGP